MKVLMSIKPKFVEQIFAGEKEWEFRRVAPQPLCRNILSWRHTCKPFCIVIYASAPVKRVVGEMMINYTEYGDAEYLLDKAKGKGGVSEEYLAKYLNSEENENMGWALHIGWDRKYDEPLTLEEAKLIAKKKDKGHIQYIKRAPQNFCYINEK